RFGYTPKSCGRYPSTARNASGSLAISVSFHLTLPSVARVIVARMLINVVLPAPFGPNKPSTPGCKSSVKSRSAWTPPRYCLLTPWIVSLKSIVSVSRLSALITKNAARKFHRTAASIGATLLDRNQKDTHTSSHFFALALSLERGSISRLLISTSAKSCVH